MSKIRFFYENELTATAEIVGDRVYIEKYTDIWFKQLLYAYDEELSLIQFKELLEMRCWERNRVGIHNILHTLGLSEYDPLEICKKTHGVSYNDHLWISFDKNENLCWEDLDPIRKHQS